MGLLGKAAWLVASLCGAGAIVLACGSPEDPVVPPPPPDDGGADTGVVVADCTGAADGTPCAGGNICANGVCVAASCGDGVTTPPEECDHGTANGKDTGCESNCKFTCVVGDVLRNCPSGNPCVANGTCDPAAHTCTPGAAVPAGTTCGSGKLCVGGDCVNGTCGDAIVTPPEQCDNGAANGPKKGCESNCTFTCSNPATDCAPVECNTMACSTQHLCQATPDITKNNQPCTAGAGYHCSNGACVAPGASCGNGIKEGGEDCDNGTAANTVGSGCEPNCKFSCTKAPDSCVDMNACDQPPTCTTVTGGQKCVLGAPKADGTACGTGSICVGGTCKASVCGDGIRDSAKSEQCDDGNTTNLDACDSQCHFEQDQRVIAMTMIWDTSICSANLVGVAVQGAARTTMQGDVDSSIKDGSLTALFKMVATDLTGQTGAVTVGNFSGLQPLNPAYAGITGTSDLDWWYKPDPVTYDGSRNATAVVTGNYTAGVLDATGRLNLAMNIGGSNTLLKLSNAHLTMPIAAGSATTPTASAGAAPGHLASEHLDPALKSYPTAGGTSGAQTGTLCGDISAASLATTALPASLISGLLKCSEGYNSNNRMLDVFVHGCTVFGSKVIKPTPTPDHVDPAAAGAAGGPYTFTTDATTKRVTACTDKNGTAVAQLQTCLDAAAYSSSFKFATDRVIIK